MFTALLTALLVPMGACGGGGESPGGVTASMLPTAANVSPEFNVVSTAVHSATAVILAAEQTTRVDAAMAGLGGGARWSGTAVQGLLGDGWVEFVLVAPAAGEFALHLHYLLADRDSAALAVRVNDEGPQQMLLAPSGTATGAIEAPAMIVKLLAGSNTVRVQALATSSSTEGAAADRAVSVNGPTLMALALQPVPPLSSVTVPASAGLTPSYGVPGAMPVGTDSSPVGVDPSTSAVASVPSATMVSTPPDLMAGLTAPAAGSSEGMAAPVGAEPTAVAAPAPVVADVSLTLAQAGSTAAPTPTSAAPTSVPAPAPVNWATPRESARIFISGHSLTDNPLGEQIVSIANSLGGSRAARYNQQIVIGSPIRFRTDRNANWAGYSRGKNRDGSGMNVVNELRSPATLSGDRYDTLVIAENHNSLGMLQWEDTVRNLRHFHERFITGNPYGRSLFYETWIDINDKANPTAWIAHERAQSRAWQCIATRINTSLAAEGRPDRITPLPTGAALVDLVERATQGNVPGVTQANTTATVNALLSDNVHLTRLGVYYMALVSYSAIYQRSPAGAAAPSGVSSEAARSLQEAAWRFVSNFYAQYREPTLDACRADVAENVCTAYWTYRAKTENIAGCRRIFGGTGADNPLAFQPATDASYWFPAP